MKGLDSEHSAIHDRIEALRDNPRIAVAIAGGALLLIAWIGWAIYVTGENGAEAGLGVVIAWPALLAAIGLVSLPFIGGYFLIRRLSGEGGGEESPATSVPEAEEVDKAEAEEEPNEDGDSEDEEDETDAEDEDDADQEDAEPEAATS